jgi:hypothetical protein
MQPITAEFTLTGALKVPGAPEGPEGPEHFDGRFGGQFLVRKPTFGDWNRIGGQFHGYWVQQGTADTESLPRLNYGFSYAWFFMQVLAAKTPDWWPTLDEPFDLDVAIAVIRAHQLAQEKFADEKKSSTLAGAA